MDEALVSIIIPSFNRGEIIGETLNSVWNQSYSNWECIVVDDGSTDNTVDIVNNFVVLDSRFTLLHRPQDKKKGGSSCRNFGYLHSKGEFVNWLDSDDLINTDHLEKHLNSFNIQNKITASISQAISFNAEPNRLKGFWAEYRPESNALQEMISGKISWQTATILWKSSELPKKPFPEKFSSCQEWTFHIKQLINDINFYMIDEPTVYVRNHANRIGTDNSVCKYYSFFYSRYQVWKELKRLNKLNRNNERELLHRMFQSVKITIRYKFDRLLFKQLFSLFKIFRSSSFKFKILQIVFIHSIIYRLTGRGETFFSFKVYD